MAVAAHDFALVSLVPEVVAAPFPAALGNAALDLLAHPALRRLGDDVEPAPAGDPAWTRAELTGRLCELSAGPDGALLSAAMFVVLDAQLNGDPVAWVSATAATFYPPDAAACGVDLAALVVVRALGARAAGRAADVLLRSGAYGLVVLDLGTSATLPAPLQGRLVQLAIKHEAAVVCLTEKSADEASLGSLVSLRGEARRRRNGTGYAFRVQALKDKRRGPGWWVQEGRLGPDGLH
jgi:recombination protein RecA